MKDKYFVIYFFSGVGILILILWAGLPRSKMYSVSVSYPQPRQVVVSPLQIAGIAPHCWFADSQFPVELRILAVGSDFTEGILPIASDNAHVTEAFQYGWTADELTPFTATLYFSAPPPGTTGVLALKSSGFCRDADKQNELDIPVIF